MKKFFKTVAVAAAVAIAAPAVTTTGVQYNIAEAKKYGSSKSSFKSSSFKSSKPSSWKKPSSYKSKPSTYKPYKKKSTSTSKDSKSLWDRSSKKTVSPAQKPVVKPSVKSNSGKSYGATGGLKKPVVKAPPRKKGLDTKIAKTSSVKSLSGYRNKFKKPVAKKPVSAAAIPSSYRSSTNRYRGYDDWGRGRSSYYNRRGWDAPSYAFHSAPSFGAWDAMFMWMMLDSINDAQNARWHHNQQNNAGYQEWRREADKLAQENDELRNKLVKLDAKTSALAGTPVDPDFIPEGIDPAFALAPEFAVAKPDLNKPVLRIGTGGTSGIYYPACAGDTAMRGLKNNLPDNFKTECTVTNGGVENLLGFSNGRFDAVFAQSDMIDGLLRTDKSFAAAYENAMKATLYPEPVQMLANEDSGIETIGDLDPRKHRIYLIGSGAAETWNGFVKQDNGYAVFNKNLNKVSSGSGQDILQIVARDKNAVMMFVSGLNNDLLKTANDTYGDQINMVVVNDWNFNDHRDVDGNSIYTFTEVSSKTYPNLIKSGWFSEGTVETLAVQAVLIMNPAWEKSYGNSNRVKVESAIWKTLPDIENKVGVSN